MYEQVEKSKDNKSRAVANSVGQKKSNVKQGYGFVDNRLVAVTQRKLTEMFNSGQVINPTQIIQRFTEIEHTPGNLKYEDSDGDDQVAEVGMHMRAFLDPAHPRKGSEPGSGGDYAIYTELRDYYDGNFIKGHLLNADLGGIGIPDNLFPITSEANSQHKAWEYFPKTLLIGQIEKYKNTGTSKRVYYEVNVTNLSKKTNFDDDPSSKLEFAAGLEDPTTPGKIDNLLEFNAGWVESKLNKAKHNSPSSALEGAGWGHIGSGFRKDFEYQELATIKPKTQFVKDAIKNGFKYGIYDTKNNQWQGMTI